MAATILIVEDEAQLREVLRVTLERANYRVIAAENGNVGIRRYRESRPDLILTDMLLPGTDGVELLRAIRQIDPEARMIAMSGGGQAAEIKFLELTKEFGAVESLAKPFRKAQLLSAVERVLATPTAAPLPHA